tara:strand:- start:1831 stop:2460 length:630 start_codon:yes stop_codon:yes gene_type:complete
MTGTLTIYMGCMFSGKSTELQRQVRRLDVIKSSYIIINHSIDNRYGCNMQSTHNNNKLKCITFTNLNDIYKVNNTCSHDKYINSSYIFIEESQFFGDLYDFVLNAVNKDGKNVILFGLDGDFRQEPFGDILRLIPHADNVIKLKSLCKVCNDGTEGLFTIRTSQDMNKQILVGQENIYITVCRKHLIVHNSKKLKGKNLYCSAGIMALK